MQFKKLIDAGVPVRHPRISLYVTYCGFARFRQIRSGEKRVSDAMPRDRPLYAYDFIEVSTRVQTAPEERFAGVKDINGTKYGEDVILGVPVVLPA